MSNAKFELSEEEVNRIIEERKALREKQKELTKALQKAKVYGADDSRHTLAVKVPVAWADGLKAYAVEKGTKVARLHYEALRDYCGGIGIDVAEDEDESGE